MSAGDVVCTGWLIKSPPEKKLKRYAWRRRWFILRTGRMSGNPNVLEYYRSSSSRKPIRTIDLTDCKVQIHVEMQLMRREFQNQHLFLVKTSSRIFYLVAKTEDEMKSWVQSIGQICHFDLLNDSRDSVNSSQQDSSVRSPDLLHTATPDLAINGDGTEGSCSDSEAGLPLDYLFLSDCETGRPNVSRCNSCSNSDRSIECSSSDNTFEDVFLPSLCPNPSSPLLSAGQMESPLSASSSFSQNLHPLADVFQFDRLYTPNGSMDGFTPPPRPPKPSHFTELTSNNGCRLTFPRRISLAELDHVKRGEFEGCSVRSWNKRLSLNLPHLSGAQSPSGTNCSEDTYIPMDSQLSSPISTSDSTSDGYLPMSPTAVKLIMASEKPEEPAPLPPMRGLPFDVDKPPVNRQLKPRRRVRPPPLDLRGLSTIRECPTHLPLTRTWTELGNTILSLPSERESVKNGVSGVPENSCFSTEIKQLFFQPNGNAAFHWPRRSNLDYLLLDFNSASPSPVQKKPLLADEDRVDYVQVDEKKTQALQNTKMEWKDVRQSKV